MGSPVREAYIRTGADGFAQASPLATWFRYIHVDASVSGVPGLPVTFTDDAIDYGATISIVSGNGAGLGRPVVSWWLRSQHGKSTIRKFRADRTDFGVGLGVHPHPQVYALGRHGPNASSRLPGSPLLRITPHNLGAVRHFARCVESLFFSGFFPSDHPEG